MIDVQKMLDTFLECEIELWNKEQDFLQEMEQVVSCSCSSYTLH